MTDSATLTPAADEAVDAPTKTADVTPESHADEPPAPWYAKYKLPEEDIKLVSRYKSEEDLVKSVPSRERAFHKRIPLPDTDAKPEDAVKAHRDILGKLGAPKDIKGYQQIADAAREKLPEALKERLGDAFFESVCREALEANTLPWQFEMQLARALTHLEDGIRAEADAKIERQDKLERALKERHGLKWQSFVTNAELLATHLDQFLMENAKGLGIEGEDGQPIKDAFTRSIKTANDPVTYAVLEHLFDLLLSEADGGPRRLGGKADDTYTEAFNYAKNRWPKRGEKVWADYARRKTLSLGGAV